VNEIKCQDCGRTFGGKDAETAYRVHFFYGLKQSIHAANIEEAEAHPLGQKRCATDGELRGRGLTFHGWPSVSGNQSWYWTSGPSK
jgi:hypothetical protein